MVARYPGKCGACRGVITPGNEIDWEPGRRAVHALCSRKVNRERERRAARLAKLRDRWQS